VATQQSGLKPGELCHLGGPALLVVAYAVYICQKSLNFTYAFKCYQQNCSWLHFRGPPCMSTADSERAISDDMGWFESFLSWSSRLFHGRPGGGGRCQLQSESRLKTWSHRQHVVSNKSNNRCCRKNCSDDATNAQRERSYKRCPIHGVPENATLLFLE